MYRLQGCRHVKLEIINNVVSNIYNREQSTQLWKWLSINRWGESKTPRLRLLKKVKEKRKA